MASGAGRAGATRTDARLRRLLVMLPWLAERGTVSTAAMAAHFGVTVDRLVRDLEQAAMCGLPPFVDELIDLVVDEDEVSMGVPRLFTRPLRLTAPEGFALVAAARAALALPGADPAGALARAIAKVEAVVGTDGVEVDLGVPELVRDLTGAVDAGTVLRLRYWAESTGEASEREVEPQKVFSRQGHWYLLAHDRRSGEQRIFRVDRIDDAAPTGESFEPVGDVPVPDWFGGAAVERVRLRLAPAASWVAEHHPVVEVREVDRGPWGRDGGGIDVVLAVVSERWLGRLLVRLGDDGELVEPERWRDLGARTAQQVLARYR